MFTGALGATVESVYLVVWVVGCRLWVSTFEDLRWWFLFAVCYRSALWFLSELNCRFVKSRVFSLRMD